MEEIIMKQGLGKGGRRPKEYEIAGGKINEVQEHTNGSDVGSAETDTSPS